MDTERVNDMECCNKKRIRTEDELKKLTNRLNRVEGQIRGIRSMLENDAYCIDILMQVSAATSALHSFSRELLNEHIRTCIADDIRDGSDEKLDELTDALEKILK
ncbi:MAG: metal-sensing transcriptional repressor [Clostridia bacterium]|nr:metal-sensing transcriptional repressor [Clostridia bacterium]